VGAAIEQGVSNPVAISEERDVEVENACGARRVLESRRRGRDVPLISNPQHSRISSVDARDRPNRTVLSDAECATPLIRPV
jgi:hypothetical protein